MVKKLTYVIFISLILFYTVDGFSDVEVISREKAIEFYPCSRCHAFLEKKDVQELKKHRDITFRHMENVTNCFLCHDRKNPDRLVMLDGKIKRYDQVTELCAQCHGLRFKKWKKNMHGHQTGGWKEGKNKRYACTHCHNPHAPKIKPMSSKPAPHKGEHP